MSFGFVLVFPWTRFFAPLYLISSIHMDTVFARFLDSKIKRQMANASQNCSLRLMCFETLWDTLQDSLEMQCPKIRNAVTSKQQHRMWPVWFTSGIRNVRSGEESAPAPASPPNKWSHVHSATEEPSCTTSKQGDLPPACCSWIPLASLAVGVLRFSAYTKSAVHR